MVRSLHRDSVLGPLDVSCRLGPAGHAGQVVWTSRHQQHLRRSLHHGILGGDCRTDTQIHTLTFNARAPRFKERPRLQFFSHRSKRFRKVALKESSHFRHFFFFFFPPIRSKVQCHLLQSVAVHSSLVLRRILLLTFNFLFLGLNFYFIFFKLSE